MIRSTFNKSEHPAVRKGMETMAGTREEKLLFIEPKKREKRSGLERMDECPDLSLRFEITPFQAEVLERIHHTLVSNQIDALGSLLNEIHSVDSNSPNHVNKCRIEGIDRFSLIFHRCE